MEGFIQHGIPLRCMEGVIQLQGLVMMVQGVYSDDPQAQLEATTRFRKLLSIDYSPPIDEVIKSGVIPRCVEFLGKKDHPQLQFVCSFDCLSLHFAESGTSGHTRVVIEQWAEPTFVELLFSAIEQWAGCYYQHGCCQI
ncbi:hypothetical protein YC2023_112404 [Brassica napus]